ncbi:MAG: ABC transporter permease, partial [Oscillospiraceae bacterium]
MNKQTAKLTIREIKGSFGRYMAIFAIIALGAGLFVGLRMSKPDFIETYDRYLHETNFYNFRLVSTLGLTQDDVDEVLKLDGVKDAEGVVSADFLYNQSDNKSIVIAAQEIPERINLIELKAGRMPEKGNECLADPEMYTEDDIGKTIKLSKQNSEQTMDTFAYDEYTIVGLTETVLYINLERGSSTLGSGSVEGYIYLPSDGFSVDYFTDIYVTVDAEGYVYSDEYKDNAETYVKPLEQFMKDRAVIRYGSIIDEANAKLADARAQYQAGLNEYEPARAEYENGVKQLKTEKTNAEAKLAEAKKQLDEAEKMLQDPSILDEKQAELDAAKAKLEKGKAEYESGLKQFETRSKSA